MKNSLLLILVLGFASTTFAQAIRHCGSEKLSCKLEDVTDFYKRKSLDASVSMFSGYNSDEPSIEPDECVMTTALTDKVNGTSYVVRIGDSDNMADIYLMQKDSRGQTSQAQTGDVSFTATVGKKFYYRYKNTMLTCDLQK